MRKSEVACIVIAVENSRTFVLLEKDFFHWFSVSCLPKKVPLLLTHEKVVNLHLSGWRSFYTVPPVKLETFSIISSGTRHSMCTNASSQMFGCFDERTKMCKFNWKSSRCTLNRSDGIEMKMKIFKSISRTLRDNPTGAAGNFLRSDLIPE